MIMKKELAIRILNFVTPYLPSHVLEEAKAIIDKEKENTAVKVDAYGLMLALGTIQNDFEQGNETVSKDEIDALYDAAVSINEYFDN